MSKEQNTKLQSSVGKELDNLNSFEFPEFPKPVSLRPVLLSWPDNAYQVLADFNDVLGYFKIAGSSLRSYIFGKIKLTDPKSGAKVSVSRDKKPAIPLPQENSCKIRRVKIRLNWSDGREEITDDLSYAASQAGLSLPSFKVYMANSPDKKITRRLAQGALILEKIKEEKEDPGDNYANWFWLTPDHEVINWGDVHNGEPFENVAGYISIVEVAEKFYGRHLNYVRKLVEQAEEKKLNYLDGLVSYSGLKLRLTFVAPETPREEFEAYKIKIAGEARINKQTGKPRTFVPPKLKRGVWIEYRPPMPNDYKPEYINPELKKAYDQSKLEKPNNKPHLQTKKKTHNNDKK